uniref:Protein kinase domain-containing protein n=1 Tax=Electrophorus electricus TaxID=8005 RepID=A0A4W4HJ52_ELEEL
MDVSTPPAPQQRCDVDVPLSPTRQSASTAAPTRLVPDPWDEDLIASLLSGLLTPLSSSPSLSVCSLDVPTITPMMTVNMAEDCVRVDSVLGQGAFATVYQATNLTTCQKLTLKVQKPANPWEFYINGQLNSRVKPRARHLFTQLHCAHLFTNGSVLVGELHGCGTLLNVVNLYKCRSEKVLPQPLVLYFTVCILHMVEELHQARLIHADIKPDNFLLGDRASMRRTWTTVWF